MIRKSFIIWTCSILVLCATEADGLLRFANGDQLHGELQVINQNRGGPIIGPVNVNLEATTVTVFQKSNNILND